MFFGNWFARIALHLRRAVVKIDSPLTRLDACQIIANDQFVWAIVWMFLTLVTRPGFEMWCIHTDNLLKIMRFSIRLVMIAEYHALDEFTFYSVSLRGRLYLRCWTPWRRTILGVWLQTSERWAGCRMYYITSLRIILTSTFFGARLQLRGLWRKREFYTGEIRNEPKVKMSN